MKTRTPIAGPHSRRTSRDGAATVEFALVAPLFMILVLGVAEMGRAIDVSTNLTAAIREGGRLASMNSADAIPVGMNANQKIIHDIRNMLIAGGINGNEVDITITHADGPNVDNPFDLQDEGNYLQLFRIKAEVAYSDVSYFPLRTMAGQNLTASIVFRLGRSELTNN